MRNKNHLFGCTYFTLMHAAGIRLYIYIEEHHTPYNSTLIFHNKENEDFFFWFRHVENGFWSARRRVCVIIIWSSTTFLCHFSWLHKIILRRGIRNSENGIWIVCYRRVFLYSFTCSHEVEHTCQFVSILLTESYISIV